MYQINIIEYLLIYYHFKNLFDNDTHKNTVLGIYFKEIIGQFPVYIDNHKINGFLYLRNRLKILYISLFHTYKLYDLKLFLQSFAIFISSSENIP